MRIAFLSHLASPRAPTGAEQSLALLAEGLSGRGHQVAVAMPGEWALAERLEQHGIAVESISIRMCWLVQYDRQPIWRQLARGVRYGVPDSGEGRLKDWLQSFAPDVVHVNCLAHLRGAAAARSLGLPVVWHLREILPPGRRRAWFAGHLRRHASQIVAVSEAVAGWVRDEGLGRLVQVVHNGVDPPAELPDRNAAREAFDLPCNAFVIGLFSQLVEHKGALDFIRAAHRAASEDKALHFLIAGDGPTRFLDQVRHAINQGAAAETIHVVAPQREIWPLLSAIDISSVTTLWPDPLPRVVMEAMAAGKPVVGYAGGGVPEMVVDGRTGLLVETGHSDALARAWLRLAGDPEEARDFGERGLRRAAELFSVAGHVDRMEAVLRGCAG